MTGVLVALGVWASFPLGHGMQLLGNWWLQLIVGGAVLALAVWGPGAWLARRVAMPGGASFLIGALFAVGAVTLAALAGSVTSLFVVDSPFVFGVRAAMESYVLKPLGWIACVGGPPAAALGCGYVLLVRRFGG